MVQMVEFEVLSCAVALTFKGDAKGTREGGKATFHLKSIELGDNYLSPDMCQKLEDAFGNKVILFAHSKGATDSTAAVTLHPDIQPHYSASKFAVIALTQAGARAFAKHGITANAFCPGVVETEPSTADLGQTESLFANSNGYIGMRANPSEGRDAHSHGLFRTPAGDHECAHHRCPGAATGHDGPLLPPTPQHPICGGRVPTREKDVEDPALRAPCEVEARAPAQCVDDILCFGPRWIVRRDQDAHGLPLSRAAADRFDRALDRGFGVAARGGDDADRSVSGPPFHDRLVHRRIIRL